jgi:hypothetical protein
MLEELEKAAEELNVSRQAVVKTCSDRITSHEVQDDHRTTRPDQENRLALLWTSQ